MQGKTELPGTRTKIELLTLQRQGCNTGRKEKGKMVGTWEVILRKAEKVVDLGEKGKGRHPRLQGQSTEEAADMGRQTLGAHH